MKIDSAALPPSGNPPSATPGEVNTEIGDHAATMNANGEPTPAHAKAGETTVQPPFAAVLASAAAPLQNKVKSSLPLPGLPTFTLAAEPADKGAIGGDGKKKGATKASGGPQKKSADEDTAPVAIPILPTAQRPLPAMPLTLPSFDAGPGLTAETSAPGSAGLTGEISNAGAGAADLAGATAHAPPGFANAAGLDHMALSLEASAGVDARNGFAATSGVHRTAKAIAEDQLRVGVTPSESARTYAAIARATSSTVTHMIHAAGTPVEEPHARKAAAAATPDVDGGATTEGSPRSASGATDGSRSGGRQGEGASGNDGGRGEAQKEQRASDPTTRSETRSGETAASPIAGAAAGHAHTAFSLPLPPGPIATPTQVTKPAEARAAFAADLMSGVERAAVSGRTDFEVRAFDGTRVAINVQLKDDKVHVGFSFDAKHTAAEATVRATLGTLETRLGERGLSTVVSFGTLQRSPHEVGVTATSGAGAGGSATANSGQGNGQSDRNHGDPRGEPQLAEVTELAPRPRDARNPKAPAPTTNGRGGWVA